MRKLEPAFEEFVSAALMEQSEFTGLFVERPQAYGWLLGAGASRTAGLPTASDVLWDMKRRYYCREENQDISSQDLQSAAVQSRIQTFVEGRGFPKQGAPREYELYFERLFGADKERQRGYLHGILSQDKGGLSVGNRVMGALIAGSFSRIIFTTNFDDVVERAVAEVGGKAISAFHIDGSHNVSAAWKNEEFPIYCKLHGDFRYDSLKNLPADLLAQNADLASCFENACNRFGLVVAGYSGRDQSIMDLLTRVLDTANPFPHGLYWLELKGLPLPGDLVEFLEQARQRGVAAHHVPIETFDAVMLRVWRNLSSKPTDLDLKVRKTANLPVSITLPSLGSAKPLIRVNALPIYGVPTACQALTTVRPVTWDDIRDMKAKADGRLILTRADKLLCWGARDDVDKILGAQLRSIDPYELPSDLNASDSLVVKGFLEETLAVSLVRGKALLARSKRSGTFVIADAHSENPEELDPLFQVVGKTTGTIEGLIAPADDTHPEERVKWAEAVRLSIEQKAGHRFLVLEPDVWIWPTRARRLAVGFLDQRRGDRLNAKYNDLVDAWARILLGTSERNARATVAAFDTGSNVENPRFEIGSRTAFTRRLTA